jgi:hypothetical protein
MALGYVLDENLRGELWKTLRRHNARAADPVSVTRVGDAPDLPLGSDDPAILSWAERAGRVLVSRDKSTMIAHLADHLRAGHHSPGVFLIRPGGRLADVISFLILASHAGDEDQWRDQVAYIP